MLHCNPKTDHSELTFGNHVVHDAHSDAEFEELPHMCHQFVEASQNCQLFAVVSPVEGNLDVQKEKDFSSVSSFNMW